MRPANLLPRLKVDDAGVAAVQFALVAPLLLLLIIGSFEIAMLLLVSGMVESSVLAASRYGVTGYTEAGISRVDRIREIIAERTFGLVDANTAVIQTLVYPSFADIGQPEPFTDANHNGVHDSSESFSDINGNGHWDPDMGKAGMGGPGDIVLYDVEYATTAITHLLQPIFGRIVHRAAVAVRNEPY